jgi:hypothetical protein
VGKSFFLCALLLIFEYAGNEKNNKLKMGEKSVKIEISSDNIMRCLPEAKSVVRS